MTHVTGVLPIHFTRDPEHACFVLSVLIWIYSTVTDYNVHHSCVVVLQCGNFTFLLDLSSKTTLILEYFVEN